MPEPVAKKARTKSGAFHLVVKLETVPEQRDLVKFDFDGTSLKIDPDKTINDLCDVIEETFADASLDHDPQNPLNLNIITIKKTAGNSDLLNYQNCVDKTFQNGESITVLAEIDVAGIAPEEEEDVEPIKKIPVSVITGFLGSGKTTLLNHILTEQHGRRIAVMENEFGEMSIDDKLLKEKLSAAEQIVVADNGCVCCTVRGDLVKMISEILDRNLTLPDDKKIEAIMLETTGMADPSPVLQTFFANERVMRNCTIDGVITVVDSKNLMRHLKNEVKEDGKINESVQQIAFADRILINKLDLVTPDQVPAILKEIRAINKTAKVIRSVKAKIDINKILNIGCYDLKRIEASIDPDFKEQFDDYNETGKDRDDHGHGHGHGDKKDGHGHGHGDKKDGHGHGNSLGSSRHTSRVSSIGFIVDGEIDPEKMDKWWTDLMGTNSKKIYRTKGILAMKGNPEKMVFQAVHEILDFQGLGPWKEDDKRQNKMVFIGEDLDKNALEKGFRTCLSN